MSIATQRRGGTTVEHSAFVGLAREITIDTTKKTVVVHDGITTGGFPLLREDSISSWAKSGTKPSYAGTEISNTPAGNIVATTLQEAINELDTEKQVVLINQTNIKSINGNSLLGSGDMTVGGGVKTISNISAAYTVVAGDLGKIINCTANSFTVSLTAAATLGSGFTCSIWNSSNTATDAITIDPAGAETVDGIATLILRRGEGLDIVSNGTNWEIATKKPMRGYAENLSNTVLHPTASGNSSIALGNNGCSATGQNSIAIGLGSSTSASAVGGVALGSNSSGNGSQAITGAGAMALGGSYASGTDSFAAAIANNTATYGATGVYSVAIGANAKATGIRSVAIGSLASAYGNGSIAIGGYSWGSTANGQCSVAIGESALANEAGKFAFSGWGLGVAGGSQSGLIILLKQTTDATPSVLVSNASAASSLNQVILPNYSSYAFSGLVVAKQSYGQGTQRAAWKVEGLITRGGTVSNTVLDNFVITTISNAPGWTLALSADNTNGGLVVTFTGAAATNIRTVATINTSEVIYA